MNPDTEAYNATQAQGDGEICKKLALIIDELMPDAENKIWHRHPVWFLDGNPITGYSKLKAGIRLMFWSGASFNEEKLKAGTGKFKDASILYTSPNQILRDDLNRWVEKARNIQWDYKNLYKRKGELLRLR